MHKANAAAMGSLRNWEKLESRPKLPAVDVKPVVMVRLSPQEAVVVRDALKAGCRDCVRGVGLSSVLIVRLNDIPNFRGAIMMAKWK